MGNSNSSQKVIKSGVAEGVDTGTHALPLNDATREVEPDVAAAHALTACQRVEAIQHHLEVSLESGTLIKTSVTLTDDIIEKIIGFYVDELTNNGEHTLCNILSQSISTVSRQSALWPTSDDEESSAFEEVVQARRTVLSLLHTSHLVRALITEPLRLLAHPRGRMFIKNGPVMDVQRLGDLTWSLSDFMGVALRWYARSTEQASEPLQMDRGPYWGPRRFTVDGQAVELIKLTVLLPVLMEDGRFGLRPAAADGRLSTRPADGASDLAHIFIDKSSPITLIDIYSALAEVIQVALPLPAPPQSSSHAYAQVLNWTRGTLPALAAIRMDLPGFKSSTGSIFSITWMIAPSRYGSRY